MRILNESIDRLPHFIEESTKSLIKKKIFLYISSEDMEERIHREKEITLLMHSFEEHIFHKVVL